MTEGLQGRTGGFFSYLFFNHIMLFDISNLTLSLWHLPEGLRSESQEKDIAAISNPHNIDVVNLMHELPH